MSGEYLRPDLHLATPFVTQLTQRTSPRFHVSSPARATQLTRPLADFGNAGLFYLCAEHPPTDQEVAEDDGREREPVAHELLRGHSP
jgi:hypothetical protein